MKAAVMTLPGAAQRWFRTPAPPDRIRTGRRAALLTCCTQHEPAPPDPAERLRHGLRRPHPARHVDASARSLAGLHFARPLGLARAPAGARVVRRSVPCRRAWRLRRV